MLEEEAASHRSSHQTPSVAVLSAACLSTSTARDALGYWRPARSHAALTNRHLPARYPGSLLLDSSAQREANGEGPRITQGAGFGYCRRSAGSLRTGAARLSQAVVSHPLF